MAEFLTSELFFGRFVVGIGTDTTSGVQRRTIWINDPSWYFKGNINGIWYDPSDITSMFQDVAGTTPAVVDGPVGRINDKSGNGNHAIQATAASRPVLKQLGNVYWLEFDGVDDFLRGTFAIVQSWDRISTIRQVSWTLDDFVFGGVTANAGVLDQTGASPNLVFFDGVALQPADNSLAVGADGVVTERHNNATSQIAVNNGNYTIGSPGVTSPGGITIAGDQSGVANSNIRLYQTIMLQRTLTTAEIASLRTQFGAKALLNL